MTDALRLDAGQPFPLGATRVDGGVNFAVFAAHAESVELCVFDPMGSEETARFRLSEQDDGVWHGFLAGANAGLTYGYRAHGPYRPHDGHRYNPHKLLLDPYAREIVGRHVWRDEHHGYQRGHPDDHRSFDTRDNARIALKSRVAAPLPPRTMMAAAPIRAGERVLYELHVKGFSKRNPAIPEPLRGTYAGLAHPASIEYLRRLGVNALSLQPVQYWLDEPRLGSLGLGNYWGYNTIGFFAAEPRLSATPDDPSATRAEFRAMVDALHANGFEVIIDVVYNHTAEGSEHGATLSFRGLDNASYYRLLHDDRARYENATGCGNTVNIGHPRVTQLVLDSMRYWVGEMGVDGFRFDLAPVLGRTSHGFNASAAFFVALQQDPLLTSAKLIAEPWDVGHHGYQLGRFPGRFMEWNDRFRDTARRYWLLNDAGRGEFARRITASSDLFHHGQRAPSASINFVCAHDGFTLTDLVSYARKHNEANGEGNRDGHDGNHSVNCGAEGPSDEPRIIALRNQLKRTLLATLLLSQGTPMLLAGDEVGRTQRGNNNGYCQDNDTTWLDWERTDGALRDCVAHLLALRRELAAVRRARWLTGQADAYGHKDVIWLGPDGRELRSEDWHDPSQHAFAGLFAAPSRADQDVLMLFNPETSQRTFKLPAGDWARRFDAARDSQAFDETPLRGEIVVTASSLVVLSRSQSVDSSPKLGS